MNGNSSVGIQIGVSRKGLSSMKLFRKAVNFLAEFTVFASVVRIQFLAPVLRFPSLFTPSQISKNRKKRSRRK
jgi:hypothetical protein